MAQRVCVLWQQIEYIIIIQMNEYMYYYTHTLDIVQYNIIIIIQRERNLVIKKLSNNN